MLSGLRISRYKSGDENHIASLLIECFGTFASFGMNREIWMKYQEIDPGFNISNAFVAKFKDEIIGHIQVINRNLKLGGSTYVKFASISNVCVLPDYRREGVAIELLNQIHSQIMDPDLHLTSLLVQPNSGAWSLYSKLGYMDVYLLEDITCGLEEIRQMIKPHDSPNKITIRNYLSGDESYMLNIYNSSSSPLVGIQKRDLDYWRRRYVSVLTYDGFFYEPFDPDKVLIAEEDGAVCGYCFLSITKDKGYIREIFATPGKEYAVASLVAAALDKFASRSIREVVFLSMLAPLYQIFKDIIDNSKCKISPHDLFMVKILDLLGLIRSLEQEICERLKYHHPITIGLRIGDKPLALKVEANRIVFGTNLGNCDTIFSMKEETFLKLLFGAVSVDEIICEDKIDIMPNNDYSKTIFRSLFPRKSFYLSQGDVW